MNVLGKQSGRIRGPGVASLRNAGTAGQGRVVQRG